MPTVDPAELLALATTTANEAATLIHQGRAGGLRSVSTKSTGTDMVTEFDHASESLIVAALRAGRPDDAIVGEEGSDHGGTSGISWLVDPIDGTTNYLYALPGYAVSIAAADDEGPLIGVVAIPTLGEVFSAVRGGGAFLDGHRIRASAKTDVATALLATGFSYDPATRVRQAGVVGRLIGSVRDIRRFGAASADLCYVACGRVDAYFERGLGPWDMAAGVLIAREAGAVTTDFAGGPVVPDQVLAAAPGIHAAMVELLAKAGAD
ncbi:MAG TPA: inositol monophosphatase family protein [Acidimicrobiales bacterium]